MNPLVLKDNGDRMKMSNQILYNTIGSSVTLFFQWLIIMMIPKIADFSDAGVFAVAISICSIMNYIATLFLNQYQVSDQYEKFSENDYFVCRLFTIIVSFILCALTIPVFNYSMKQGLTIIGYMVYRNFIHFAYLHMATMQINQHLDYAGKCMIIEGVVSFISFVVSYCLCKDIAISTFIMAILGGGIFLITMSVGYRKIMGVNYPMKITNFRVLWPMILVGIPLMISVMFPAMITAFPKIILQMYWSDEIVGIFSTLTAPTIIIPTLVTGIFTPFIIHFSNLGKKGDLKTIRTSFLKVIILTILFGAVALVISLLCAEFVFKLLYGEQIVQYVHYFHILLIGITIFSVGLCGITVLITKEQGREAALMSAIALVVSAIIFLVTIPEKGMDAATYGLMASYSLFSILISVCVFVKPITNR